MTNEERLRDFFTLEAGRGTKYYKFVYSGRLDRVRALGKDIGDKVFYNNFDLELPVLLPVKVYRGRHSGDLHGVEASILLASRRLLETVKALGVSSARASAVEVYDRNDREVLDVKLYWLRVRKCAGPVDLTKGAPLLGSPGFSEHLGRPDSIGLYFDVDTWDGSEVFTCSNYVRVIVTRRVAEAIQAAKLENVKLTPILEYGKETRDFLLSAGKDRQGPVP